jgi:nucleoside-diphosphate-sugar epimerase
MHALVTGGGGFLGQAIVEQLVARGNRVRTFSRRSYPRLATLGVEQRVGDITDAQAVDAACQGVDCVLHAAALPGIGMRADAYYAVNHRGTQHVLAACRRQGVARLVYTSSPSVTFAGKDQCGVDESSPIDLEWLARHRAYYSHSKALAERDVLEANGADLRTCALRPHLIWGPRDSHLIPRLIARARQGKLRRVGEGSNRVDMIYVDNAAHAHLLAADALDSQAPLAAGKAYFLSQGEPVNCWQWIDELLALVDLSPVRRSISLAAAWRLGFALEEAYRWLRLSGEPPMTRFLAAQLAQSHWFDIGAARREMGYEPLVSTEEGMRRLGSWLQATPVR